VAKLRKTVTEICLCLRIKLSPMGGEEESSVRTRDCKKTEQEENGDLAGRITLTFTAAP
jgi:hypothetical protein